MPKYTQFILERKNLFFVALFVIILTAALTLLLNNLGQKPVSKIESDTAVNQAKLLYSQKKERDEDLTNGPCLSDALMPNWVVDLVHNPRISADDLPQNQCPAYLEGRAEHFVELDLDGNLIKVK